MDPMGHGSSMFIPSTHDRYNRYKSAIGDEAPIRGRSSSSSNPNLVPITKAKEIVHVQPHRGVTWRISNYKHWTW